MKFEIRNIKVSLYDYTYILTPRSDEQEGSIFLNEGEQFYYGKTLDEIVPD